MKKLLSTLAILGAMISSSQAATVNVTGAIDPIIIGPVFNLSLVTINTTPDNPNTPANEFLQVFPPTSINGNLYFGTVDMTAAGIYATTATGSYTDTAHRAGGHYTETRLYMDNNQSNFTVSLTVSGNLIGLAAPLAGQSVMHVFSTSLLLADGAGATTQFPANIQIPDTMRPVPNGTPIQLYNSGTPVSPISDAFKSLVFLDFLPINIPAATYTGASTWTLQSF